jgi:hypothetical protein
MNCGNCGAQLSCGCQVRTASNNARVCSTCVATYEANLAKINQQVIEAKQDNNNSSLDINNTLL